MVRKLPLFVAVVLIAFGSQKSVPEDYENPYRYSRPARGTIHAHSIYSNDITYQMRGMIKDADHVLSEDVEAMIKRGERLGLNFLLLQDHGEKLTLGHWYREGELERNSDRVNRQSELGLLWVVRGFEWTQGSLLDPKPIPHKAREGEINHVGVFRTEDFTGTSLRPETGMPVSADLASIYGWLLKHDPNKVFCSFNHPSYGSSQFNSFAIPAHMERIVDYFRMIEVGSGSSIFYEGPDKLERYYRSVLRQGWRLMPAIGADNPGKLTWQNARKRHTAVWVDNVRGQHPFFDHVRECCGFASEDEDAVAELWLGGVHDATGNDRRNPVMGQPDWLPCSFKPTVINYRVYDEGRAEGYSKVILVRVRNDEVREQTLGRILGSEPIVVDASDICCYLKAVQSDGDEIITAPIWVTHRQRVASVTGFNDWLGDIRLELHGVLVGTRGGRPVLTPAQPELHISTTRRQADPGWNLTVRWEKVGQSTYPATEWNTLIDKTPAVVYPLSSAANTSKDWCTGRFPDPDRTMARLEAADTPYRATLYWEPRSAHKDAVDILSIDFYVRPKETR